MNTTIQVIIFLAQCAVLHLFVKIVKWKSYDKHIIRSIICAGGALVLHTLVAGWIQSFFNVHDSTPTAQIGSFVLLYLCAFPLVRYIIRPGFFLTPVTCLVLIATTYGLHVASVRFSAESPQTAYVQNPAIGLPLALPKLENSTNALEIVTSVTDGIDAAAALKNDKALGSDLKRGIALFKERKQWMDNLSDEERVNYRSEMRQFLSQQGLAEDPSSLAAIRSANSTNLPAFASLFEHLEATESGTSPERSQQISASLTQMSGNLKGMELSRTDMFNLQKVSELLAVSDTDGAMDEIRKQIKSSGGNNKLAGTMLAALLQTKSGVPADMITSEQHNKRGFDFGGLLPFMKDEKEPVVAKAKIEQKPDVQTSLADVTIEEELLEVSAATHVPISAQLGIVHVPSGELALAEWISTVQSLRVNGYVSLGDETVILLDNGTMYHCGDIWQLEHQGFQYRFSIDKVLQNKVHLTGIERVPASSELAQL